MSGPDPQRTIALGRVVDAWGVRGWVKVEPYGAADDTVLTSARRWHVRRPVSPAHAPIDLWIDLERARRHASTVVAKPLGIDDRDAALALKGAEVGVRRADFPPLPDDEVYWVDLVGCAVTNPAGDALGRVVAVDDHGAHPILETDAGLLIPFVDAYVVEVEPAEDRIVVDWQADWSR
ncbi:MAG TPA: ribosome maturation factor RimM [Burkholderiaceae bacterium]|nr:ribosome maturation factor RimM [Burkholderiaceae bacterium]